MLKLKELISGFSNITIYLPFGLLPRRNYETNIMEMDSYDLSKNQYVKSNFRLVTFSLQEEFGRKVLYLSITFYANPKPVSVVFKPQYKYKWTKKSVTIKQYIATTNADVVEKLAKKLLVEARRFFYCYC